MEKIFILEHNSRGELVVASAEIAAIEREKGVDGEYKYYTVLVHNGEIEEFIEEDIFDTLEAAEEAAAFWNAEHKQIERECREEAAEAYYADVLAQCLV